TSASPPGGANEFMATLSDLRATMSLNGQEISNGTYYDPLTFTVTGQDNLADAFALDLSDNTYRGDVVAFHGGDGPSIDWAEIHHGSFASITQNLSNRSDGHTLITPTGGAPGLDLHWTGLESFVLDVDSIDQLNFELPAGASAILEDADPTDLVFPGI